MRARSILVSALVAAAAGCGTAKPHAEPPTAPKCVARLDADLPPPTAGAPLVVPPSNVVVDLAVDTAAIVAALDREVPRRVAQGKGIDVGALGKASFHVDRGAWGASVRAGALHVETELSGHAEVCKPLGPFGCPSYASCDPGARADASIPLVLGADYRLPSARVAIPITRPCTVTSLGLDVTGRLQHEADVQADRVRREIDASIPSLEPGARALFSALAIVLPLSLESCVKVRPTAVLQGAAVMRGPSSAGVPLGVVGEVTVESPCATPGPPASLPPPRFEPALAPGVSLEVPIALGFDDVSRELDRSAAPLDVAAGAEPVRITDLRAVGGIGALELDATLVGRACGTVRLLARPSYDAASGGVVFASVRPAPGELERVARLAPTVDLAPIAAAVRERARIPLPIDLASVPRRLEQAIATVAGAAAASAGPHAPEVAFHIDGAKVESVVVAAGRVAALASLHGSAAIRLR